MKKVVFVAYFIATILAVALFIGLFYLSEKQGDKIITKSSVSSNNFSVNWRNIRITENEPNLLLMNISMPQVVIYNNQELESEINEAITWYIEAIQGGFVSGVRTAAEDNGEINILNIDTNLLLATPRLLSFAFIETSDMAGINDNDPEQLYITFDLEKGEWMKEGLELFRDDSAWADAVRVMKSLLLSNYQGEPNCDLLFAPQKGGFVASCIGRDYSRGGEHISITGDIPLSAVQDLVNPEILKEIK